jgi:hypothetical protein
MAEFINPTNDVNKYQVSDGSIQEATLKTLQDIVDNTGTALAFSTSTPLTNGQTYDSGVLDMSTSTQVQTSILSDKNGTIVIDFIRDLAGTDILRTLTIPYIGGSGFKMFSSVAFTPYIRYRFTCDETGQTDFYFDTKLTKTSLSPQILDLNAFVSESMVSTLNRSLLLGQDGDGSFSNVSVVETSNNAGTYHSLQVVNGARPSQLFGRTAVSIVVDGVSASSLLHTVTANKTFYVTDINLTVDNSASVAGVLKLENGIIAAQTVVSCYMIADPPGSASSNTIITHSFIEPLQFDTGVWLNESAGTLVVCGTINGYEE